MVEALARTKVARVCKEEGLPPELKKKAVEGVKCEDDLREPLIQSYVNCWKKYFPNTPIGPEVVAVGGTMQLFNGWRELIAELRAMGAELRDGKPAA